MQASHITARCAADCHVLPSSELFAALERTEGLLGKQRYLVGDQLTEADVRLFQTLIRFDEVRLTTAWQLVCCCYLRQLGCLE
jgi:glutathionyl-hydroquinone reductase